VVYTRTKNPNFGIFLKASEWKILRPFGILRRPGVFYGHFVDFVVVWYTFCHFGNPGSLYSPFCSESRRFHERKLSFSSVNNGWKDR
jgi:hypothetical protein